MSTISRACKRRLQDKKNLIGDTPKIVRLVKEIVKNAKNPITIREIREELKETHSINKT